ncbi:MAG: 30S ribosomal protein S8 [Pseudomonadales bacterium]|nr:30S ribosomal protein S8 [Candidatus Woesebacteria bacterium]MCB9801719.1 30S ribosomal protein S8 [Pseudomonadales bacterium]
MTDPIADMLIRIKNGFLARHTKVSIPFSKAKKSIADILVAEGYLADVQIVHDGSFDTIQVTLQYKSDASVIHDVKRLSRPGRRLYAPSKSIPRALGGYGITIVSTSKGIMTDTAARKQNVGGELLCQVW